MSKHWVVALTPSENKIIWHQTEENNKIGHIRVYCHLQGLQFYSKEIVLPLYGLMKILHQ